MGELGPSHYVLLNKFQVLDGHVLIVTRRFERQECLLGVDDFAALALAWAKSMGSASTTAASKPGRASGASTCSSCRSRSTPTAQTAYRWSECSAAAAVAVQACVRTCGAASDGAELHALYRELLDRCGISAVAEAEGEVQSAPYNLLVRRGWMLVVPRSRACFESISVNGLGFSGSLFLRSQEELERVRAVGPMQVLRAVAMPQP